MPRIMENYLPKLEKYLPVTFPKYMSTPERERIIISLLEKWKEEQDNKG